MRRRHPESGFTLIEILIVLLIVGIMSGAAVLGLGDRAAKAALAAEADRLRGLLAYAGDYSLAHQQALGIIVEDGYALTAFDERRRLWAPLGEEKEAADGRVEARMDRPDGMERPPRRNGDPPDILIYPDGSAAPFAVLLRWQGKDAPALRLTLAGDGTFSAEERE